jgi:hypothetical protein
LFKGEASARFLFKSANLIDALNLETKLAIGKVLMLKVQLLSVVQKNSLVCLSGLEYCMND